MAVGPVAGTGALSAPPGGRGPCPKGGAKTLSARYSCGRPRATVKAGRLSPVTTAPPACMEGKARALPTWQPRAARRKLRLDPLSAAAGPDLRTGVRRPRMFSEWNPPNVRTLYADDRLCT